MLETQPASNAAGDSRVTSIVLLEFDRVVNEIYHLKWQELTEDELLDAAWAYYFFSVQFRENLQIARRLYPDDVNLRQLEREECGTDNLSPWPGVATAGEKMDHDEFMRRLLQLSDMTEQRRQRLEALGREYPARRPRARSRDKGAEHRELRGWRP